MLYKNDSETLDMELFRCPTAEYRAAPFWAWNCELAEDELLWQIEQLKKMGFGVCITSDCHDAKQLDCHFAESEELLDRIEWALNQKRFIVPEI